MSGAGTWLMAVLGAAGVDAGTGPAGAPPAPVLACLPPQPAPGPGVIDPFHVPAPSAAQLNADGKVLYRQGRWEQARDKYRTAEAQDPQFLAPALNVACSFVRQERYQDAVSEVIRLIDRAYIPWGAEVLAAADLGALKIRPEGRQVRFALEAARSRWADGLDKDVILLARLRAPLSLAGTNRSRGGEGLAASAKEPPSEVQALVLGQRQEIFAWSPRTRRYRQLTNEEGRVLAVARSAAGERMAYATAEKLIRGPGPAVALRGVAVTEVALGTLTVLGRAAVSGDVERLEILPTSGGFAYRVGRSAGTPATFALAGTVLEPRFVGHGVRPVVVLTGQGVTSLPGSAPLPGGCPGAVREVRVRQLPAAVIVTRGRPPVRLQIGSPHGAGLAGLPIP